MWFKKKNRIAPATRASMRATAASIANDPFLCGTRMARATDIADDIHHEPIKHPDLTVRETCRHCHERIYYRYDPDGWFDGWKLDQYIIHEEMELC
jgi:hypothetical protein